MDHDAMNTHVTKLKVFRDDFLTLSGLTAEQFHEMAENHRAGEPIGNLVPKRLQGAEMDHEAVLSPEQLVDLTDHVKEISETVSSLQLTAEQFEANADTVSWLVANREALQGLIAGAQAPASAINDVRADDGTPKAETEPTAPVEASGTASAV